MEDTRRTNLQYSIIKDVTSKNGNHMVGKTIARLDNCGCDAMNIVAKQLANCTHNTYRINHFGDVVYLADTYTAKSKLNVPSGDVYVEEEGKRIARERVLDKYHNDLNSALCDYLQDAREVVARLEHYMQKHNIDYTGVLTEAEIKSTKLSGKRED